jgi:hypothetical protein
MPNGIGYNFTNIGDWNLEGIIDEKAIEQAMYETLDELEALIEEHFADNEGEWKALAAATIRQRKYLGFAPGPILGRSGTLRENVARNKQVTITGTEVFGSVSPAEATAPYADVPITEYFEALDAVRPFFYLSDEETDKLFDILEEKIAEKLGFI